MEEQAKTIIGRNTAVEFVGHAVGVPAKVDTGADSSAVWASNITMHRDGTLSFQLFGETSPYYTGETIYTKIYKAVLVRGGTGHQQIRYKTEFSIKIHGRTVRVYINLADRSTHKFPVLIGRRTLANKFLVDVSESEFEEQAPKEPPRNVNEELIRNPYEFHQKYYGNDVEEA